MGSIYLIRHGQASFGADDYDVLSPLGVQQAEILGDYLINTGVTLDACFSGDMLRQKDTALAALARFSAANLPAPGLSIDSAFNEIDVDSIIRLLLPKLADSEPNAINTLRNPLHNRAEFQRLFALIIQRWATEVDDIPQSLRWSTFTATVNAGLQRILDNAASTDQIGIFTSGGTITAFLHLLTGVAANKAFDLNWQIVNTSLSRLKFRDDSVVLTSFNSQAHLDLLKNKELITFR
ncbi:histidine phosphatase family protein [Denitrificimonas caeni]|uniref:Phosphoglycerate mutase family protein n=1 Tax=Denitrificimonas caeni TaxID=521720 RepID=A0AAE9VRB6_9GAMM|nr:histidine phosphatase family protein [Denitrificimonas caeni]WBE24329.1 phosphoglycerate mutase family protein [Denitrificimonas caeni]